MTAWSLVGSGAGMPDNVSGEGVCRKLKKRIAFVCVGNSCRSQMAEALAGELSNRPDIEFLSMGTHPAPEVDPKALEVLREENVIWHGKPKSIKDKQPIDVAVTMGCDVACPVISGAQRIEWSISDPRGKDIEDYRRALGIIKEKVAELLREID